MITKSLLFYGVHTPLIQVLPPLQQSESLAHLLAPSATHWQVPSPAFIPEQQLDAIPIITPVSLQQTAPPGPSTHWLTSLHSAVQLHGSPLLT